MLGGWLGVAAGRAAKGESSRGGGGGVADGVRLGRRGVAPLAALDAARIAPADARGSTRDDEGEAATAE